MRDEPNAGAEVPESTLIRSHRKVSIAPDSRTVATEVGTRQGVCNNSPAEATGPENGGRSSVATHAPPQSHTLSNDGALRVGGRGGRRGEGPSASRTGTAAGADLGGSSNYSNETLEGRRGRGFRVNGNRTRVSRS